MISTARIRILNQLETDIVNLISTNGYELTSKKFVKGFNPTAYEVFPFICYEIGQAQYTPITDDLKGDLCKGTMLLALHYCIKADKNKQGELVTMGERALNDFRKFVHQSNSINPTKVFNLQNATNRVVQIKNWYVSSEVPSADNVQSNAIASVLITVNFTEAMNSQLTENLIEES